MSTAEKGAGGQQESTQWEKSASKFKSKPASEFFDPCQEYANLSIKCMHRNAGDRDMCTDYFQAYRDCKKAWMTERKFTKKSES